MTLLQTGQEHAAAAAAEAGTVGRDSGIAAEAPGPLLRWG